jgi:hypothetical protein
MELRDVYCALIQGTRDRGADSNVVLTLPISTNLVNKRDRFGQTPLYRLLHGKQDRIFRRMT